MGGPHGQETHAKVKEIEETKRERSVEGKTYASIVEKPNTGPENAIAGPNDCMLWKTTNLV